MRVGKGNGLKIKGLRKISNNSESARTPLLRAYRPGGPPEPIQL
jgi:hypothetical protein